MLAVDNGSWQKHDVLDWTSGESHVFPASSRFSFVWSPNQTVRFAMWEKPYWILDHNSTMVDSQDVGGPLAVWRINALASIAEGRRSLEFEIEDCPGPPIGKGFPRR